ncbi:hypothetical protein ANAPH1_00529 [Anaplasma phagocytophilum]|nr:hypothetical protein ANAPH1_00529 [Anaplasma phagocytophilum]SCV65638.1 hypothetical protein ANAPH2_01331 [Anaplasma phagocytophilum]
MTKSHSSGPSNKFGQYAGETKDDANGSVAVCSGTGGNSTSSKTMEHVLKDFEEKTLLNNGSKNWPTSSGTGQKTNDNADAVAKDLTKLTPEEKTIVAGLLAKTIEGGEVVEIRAVSSTSVMALELWVCW